MRCVIDILAAALCAIPLLILAACAWWFFHERTPEPELTARAAVHISQQMEQVAPVLTHSDIKKAYEILNGQPVVLVAVKKGKVTLSVHDADLKHAPYYMALEEVLNKYGKHLKDNLCLWVINDQAQSIVLPPELRHVPLFVFAIDTHAMYQFLPLLNVDAFTLRKWPRLYDSINRNIVSIDKQLPVLFWRGKASDIRNSSEITPRSHLVEWSEQYPEKINARFTKIYAKDESLNKDLHQKYKECSVVGEVDHLKYRYQMVMDGVTATFPGFLWRLASGCVTLKQDSPHRQWFYEWVEPHKHYVPIQSDLSDILDYLNEMPDDHLVAHQARELVQAELTPAKVLGYFVGILNQFSEHVKEE